MVQKWTIVSERLSRPYIQAPLGWAHSVSIGMPNARFLSHCIRNGELKDRKGGSEMMNVQPKTRYPGKVLSVMRLSGEGWWEVLPDRDLMSDVEI